MFAPRSGPYLLVSAGALALLTFGVVAGWAGPPLPAAGLLAVGWGGWAFLAAFFRDPERPIGAGIVAAADGRIVSVEETEGFITVSTFMNVTNVHVNRFPLSARVERVTTTGSGHRPAYRPDARHNRRRHYELATAIGPVEVVQMTGIVARRLVSLVAPGAERAKGDRLGMIVLGSRVDLRFPADRVRLVVRVGDRVRAGTTTVAEVVP